MTLTQSWLRQPQKLWLRKALFQVHLWSGVALGIYTVVVCASGSAVVFRTDIENALSARTEVQNTGTMLTREQLRLSAQRLYPDFVIRSINRGRFATEATEIQMTRGWREKRRLFNPFTGQDIGPSPSVLFWWLRFMGDLHGNLLLGPAGLTANGVGGALVSILCLSGIVIWWPGLANWRRSLWVRGNVGWKRLNWDLHSAFGIWTFAILLMWGVTGAYFIFPEPFRAVINYFTPIYPTRAQLLAFQQQAAGTGIREHRDAGCECRPFALPPAPSAAHQRRKNLDGILGRALRQLRGLADEGAVGHSGLRAGGPVCNRHDHVVEPRAQPRRQAITARLKPDSRSQRRKRSSESRHLNLCASLR